MANYYKSLHIENLMPIRKAHIEFGDITFFVGPQATGKSILLQTFFLLDNIVYVIRSLKQQGYIIKNSPAQLLESFLGMGVKSFIDKSSVIRADKENSDIYSSMAQKIEKTPLRTFYIPAQRVVTIEKGWPRNLSDFDSTYPFVVKDFSNTIRHLLDLGLGSQKGPIFPQTGRLKESIRKSIDDSIFHGSSVEIDTVSNQRRFVLKPGEHSLPIMTWSAGQREFMPMLLGLYYLLPRTRAQKKTDIHTVIVEEPETGLHPGAIKSVMLTLLELAGRGYRVAVSTHSADVLQIAWLLNFLRRKLEEAPNDRERLTDIACELLGPDNKLKQLADSILQKEIKVYFASLNKANESEFEDISDLDAMSDNEKVASWGGITRFATNIHDLVAKAACL